MTGRRMTEPATPVAWAGRRLACSAGLLAALVVAVPAGAETFRSAPIAPEAGIDVFTRAVARAEFDRELFSHPYDAVVLAQVDIYDRFPYLESRTFQVVSDPGWNRLLVGAEGRGLAAFDGSGTSVGPLAEPRGLALAPGGRIYIADSGNHRVVVLESSSEWNDLELRPVGVIPGLERPYDVAFSDAGTPEDPADDRLYVAETGMNRVVSFQPEGTGARRLDAVGELGSGRGFFAGPIAIAVGHAAGRDTRDVFVADAHNRRIVHLRDENGHLAWVESRNHDFDLVTSLDTDHWGNLYVAGPRRGVAKLSPNLEPVAEIAGSDGPRSVHVVFADVRDHRNGTVTRAGQPRALAVEAWTPQSGMRRWDLGLDLGDVEIDLDRGVEAGFLLTDQASVTADIVNRETGAVVATRDLGELPAGRHRSAILDQRLPEASHHDLRLTARSSYENGPTVHLDAPLIPGTGAAIGARALLLGNRPNPFQAATEIRFVVPGSAALPVNVDVFDLSGRRVTTLLNEEVAPGLASVRWDGVASDGRPVGAGVYFYRVTVGDERMTAKMLRIQ